MQPRFLSRILLAVLPVMLFVAACRPEMISPSTNPTAQWKTAVALVQAATESARSTNTPPLDLTVPTGSTRTPIPTATPWPSPWGPLAEVVASLPKSFPCEQWAGDGCMWNYSVIFQEKKGVGATIERIRRAYVDRNGGVWTTFGGTGWSDETVEIPPLGENTFRSWVRWGKDNMLMGGQVEVSYEGHDANGNPFSGKVTATLAWSEWPTYTPEPVGTPTSRQ